MLFTPPTPAFEAVQPAAEAVVARIPELGAFSGCGLFLGTGMAASLQMDVRTASRWLSARRPETFQAGRKRTLGTDSLALFKTMVRAASGWLSARPSEIFTTGQAASLGTADRFANQTGVRTASRWLSARRPEFSMNCSEAQGASDYHLPVFPQEVIEWSGASQDTFVIDGTLGGGGHSELFLQAGARVLGAARDGLPEHAPLVATLRFRL